MRLPYTYKIQDLLTKRNFEAMETDPVPQFHMSLTTAVANLAAATAGAFFKIPLDTTEFEFPTGICRLSTDDMVIPEAGLWLFHAGLHFSENLTDGTVTAVTLFRNGTELKRMNADLVGAANATQIIGSCQQRVKKDDVVDARGFFNASPTAPESIGVNGRNDITFFSGVLISP